MTKNERVQAALLIEIKQELKTLKESLWRYQRTVDLICNRLGMEVNPIFRPQTPAPDWSESDDSPESQVLEKIKWAEEEEEEEATASD